MDPDWWNLEIDSILFWKLTPSGRRRKIQSYVALEFGFPKDLVRDVLMANDFPTSGDLVNYLSCLEDDVDHQKAHKAQVAEMHEAMRERTAKREEERQRAEEEERQRAGEEERQRVNRLSQAMAELELEKETWRTRAENASGREKTQAEDKVANLLTQLERLRLEGEQALITMEKRQKLEKETLLLRSTEKCYLCHTNKRQHVLFPCCHFSLCTPCLISASVCPTCHTPIESSVKTFLL